MRSRGGNGQRVLGILSNWEEFAQTIMSQTPLTDAEKAATRCCICDDSGAILADSAGQQLKGRLEAQLVTRLFDAKQGHEFLELDSKRSCVAHARAPGFETYSAGWHSVIVQEV